VQELPFTDREKAARLAGELIDSGHANLAMLFQAATLRHMREQDVSCMVLPGSFSYTRASRALRAALWRSSRSVIVHRTPASSKAFAGRSVQAAVLMVGRERKRRDALRLARIELQADTVNVTERWTAARSDGEPDNWFWNPADERDDEAVCLGEIATVRRGTATGANEMFFVTDDIKASLPPDVVLRGMPTLRGFDAVELTESAHEEFGGRTGRRWLLAIPQGREIDGALQTYIQQFEEVVSKRHLAKQRACWYSITDLSRPQILISPLAKKTFKVVLNTVGAVPSNNLFGITRTDGGDPRHLAEFLRSDHGQAEIRRLSRRYPGGSHKIEPRRLREVRLSLAAADPAKTAKKASRMPDRTVTVAVDLSE
jgi:hypothetical protein